MFPKIGVPQNGWLIMENPIKMDHFGVPLFLETPICWLQVLTIILVHMLFLPRNFFHGCSIWGLLRAIPVEGHLWGYLDSPG